MLFSLQKIAWFLALPPASLLLLIVAGTVLLRRKGSGTGKFLICTGVLLFYLLSIGPVADLLLKPLESAAPPLRELPAVVDAVVVPGGGAVDRSWLGAGPVPGAESWCRLIQGVDLSRRTGAPLVLTGGNGEPFAGALNDADVMLQAALAMGIPRSRIVLENVSRNTLENSLAVRRVVKGNRIVLSTSAYYMKRASAMFRKRGFTVVPAPVYPLAENRPFTLSSLIPRAGTFASSCTALAEWMSLAWWGIRGEM